MPDDVNSAALLEVLKDIRNELRHHRALLLEAIDQGRTVERAMDAQILALPAGIDAGQGAPIDLGRLRAVAWSTRWFRGFLGVQFYSYGLFPYLSGESRD